MRQLCCLLIAVALLLSALRGPALAQMGPPMPAAPAASSATPSPAPVIPYDLDSTAFYGPIEYLNLLLEVGKNKTPPDFSAYCRYLNYLQSNDSKYLHNNDQEPPQVDSDAECQKIYTPQKSQDNPYQVLFVLADGGDAPTRGRFVSEVTRQLETFYQVPHGILLVPEPTWAVPDYMNACANVTANTQTRGALIVEITSVSNSSANWFWQKASWTELSGALLFSSCAQDHSKSNAGSGAGTAESAPNPLTPVSQKDITWEFGAKKGPQQGLQRIKYSTFNTPGPKPTLPPPYVMRWGTNVYDQTGYTKNVTPLPVAGVALSLVSVAIPFIPSRTATGQDTTVYPTPYPWLPGSPNGYVSQRQTTNTTTTNTQSETTLATGFLGSSITYDQNLNALPSTTDDSSMRAVRNVVASFLQEVGCYPNPQSRPLSYGVDLKMIVQHNGMCADLGMLPRPSPNPSPPPLAYPVFDKADWPPYISVTSLTATGIRGPNNGFPCPSPSPPGLGAPPTASSGVSPTPTLNPMCGVEVIATIQNLTHSVRLLVPTTKSTGTTLKVILKPSAINMFRLRCKAFDESELVVNNEAAEPFGPLPLDPEDKARYTFYLSNITLQSNITLHNLKHIKCYVSLRIDRTWYDRPDGVPSGIY
jgi:hypothetical protein